MPDASSAVRYFDREGQPLDLHEWGAKFEDWEYKQVEKTNLPCGLVSTVWLGLDHQYGDGPPLIFETMFFANPGENDTDDDLTERYSTLDEARAGHAAMVERLS